MNNQGTNGNYWSSSPNGTNGYNLNFNSTAINPSNNNNRANGFSVRCFKNYMKSLNIKSSDFLIIKIKKWQHMIIYY